MALLLASATAALWRAHAAACSSADASFTAGGAGTPASHIAAVKRREGLASTAAHRDSPRPPQASHFFVRSSATAAACSAAVNGDPSSARATIVVVFESGLVTLPR